MSPNKIIIYQVFTRLFGNKKAALTHSGSYEQNGCGKMADFTQKALQEIKSLGVTHIWYTGVIEHATQNDYTKYGIRKDHKAIVKGKAGSPYAIKDYYDIDPDLAKDVPNRMKEFENLVKRTHKCGLKAIIDFVPNHVARQYHSDTQPANVKQLGEDDNQNVFFDVNNNFYYVPGSYFHGQFDLCCGESTAYQEFPAKATGNDRFDAYPTSNDWYETIKLNYGVDYLNNGHLHLDCIPNTWHKMLDILFFWCSKEIDGFRCDMAEMVPVEFWEWAIPQIKSQYPEIIFIAEVYNPYRYRDFIFKGKFDFLYNKVGLYDTLRAIMSGYCGAENITNVWQSQNDIQQHMLHFLENHDEQRVASLFFANDPKKALPALVVSATMNTCPMMIYFGQEFGEKGMDDEGFSGLDGRTTIFDYWSVDTIRRWRNNDKFNGKLLTEDEKSLYRYYQRLLTLCNRETALREGLFFDLMYANQDKERFNSNKLYAYLRKYENELIIAVANFDAVDTKCEVIIPRHAFEFLQIKENQQVEAIDLLTDEKETFHLQAEGCISMKMPAYSAKLFKVTL